MRGECLLICKTPDFETRCAIVQSKAQAHGLKLPPDVVELLANLVHSNIRELEGVLNQLLAYCEMRNLEPDLQIAEALFSNSNNQPRQITAKQILEQTARYYSIDFEDIVSAKRDKEIVVPRQIAMHLIRSELKLSFPKIARECGRKDHTTAIHAVDKISKELSISPQLRQQVVELKGRLYV